ncbi:GA-like domain-containing protein [Psychrobacter lutiphocae]|uniref:GA-like domain-containing protein n=1 Tax=Psychrobacter lutiphocae TaxID=540500 RepID=UPI0019187898|nr:hypothetical protein [Psychrobacter lutiphocae]
MKTVTVKVNNATQTIAEHQVVTKNGQPTVIQATNKVNYELVDQATGRAPNHIVTKRVGNDLHLSLEDDSQDSDLIIEGFYEDADSALIGLAEDGQYYYYTPDSGEVTNYVTELLPGDIEGQALGGQAQVTPWWVGATQSEGFDTLPWLFGLAGLGVVGGALASGGSSSSSYVPPVDTSKEQVAQDAIDKAKDAEQAAKDALEQAEKDGVITPEEQQTIIDANKALEDAKKNAQDAIDQLPESAGKGDLQSQLDEIGNGVNVPEITDKDGDGINDLTDATAKVEAAEKADQAAKDALDKANADGVITPEEQQTIIDANKKVEDAKKEAQDAINKLDPSKDKEGLQDRLGNVDGVNVPEITDKDSDDIAVQDAQDAIDKAQQAEKDAQDALDEANKDGVITPEEQQAIEEANKALEDAKQEAQDKINELPESASKDNLQSQLDEIGNGVNVPEVTDKDGDGLDDTLAQQVQDAIDKAKDAEQAAKDALEDAQKDGVITPEEQQTIIDANKALEDAKQEAKDKIDQLPDSTGKTELQEQLDQIGGGVDVPEVTDKDGDGVDDATAKVIQDLINEAKAAEEAANKALEDAKGEDGLITPTEQQAIEKANQAVADAKDKAQQEINKLDPSKGKETLQGNLDAVNGVEVPAVNDKNSDDINDLTDAQNKVAAAEEAQREAEQALKDAEANGSITQQEHDDLQDLQDKVVEAKQAAQEAINLLDPSKDKEGLQAKLGEVDGIVVPAVTDSTGDGLDDTLAQQVQDAIDKAKDAEQAAKDALEDAQKDGVITPEEQQTIIDANKALEDAALLKTRLISCQTVLVKQNYKSNWIKLVVA